MITYIYNIVILTHRNALLISINKIVSLIYRLYIIMWMYYFYAHILKVHIDLILLALMNLTAHEPYEHNS